MNTSVGLCYSALPLLTEPSSLSAGNRSIVPESVLVEPLSRQAQQTMPLHTQPTMLVAMATSGSGMKTAEGLSYFGR